MKAYVITYKGKIRFNDVGGEQTPIYYGDADTVCADYDRIAQAFPHDKKHLMTTTARVDFIDGKLFIGDPL